MKLEMNLRLKVGWDELTADAKLIQQIINISSYYLWKENKGKYEKDYYFGSWWDFIKKW